MDIICETDGLKRFRFFSVKKAFLASLVVVVRKIAGLPHAVFVHKIAFNF